MADERAAEVEAAVQRAAVCASICCASNSPRMICSVKFFEPTTMLVLARRRQPASASAPPAARRRASRRVKSPAARLRSVHEVAHAAAPGSTRWRRGVRGARRASPVPAPVPVPLAEMRVGEVAGKCAPEAVGIKVFTIAA